MGKPSGFESRQQSFTALGECGSGGRKAGIKQPQQRVRRKSNAFGMSQRDAVFDKAVAIVGLAELAARIGEGSRGDDFDRLDGSWDNS